MGSDLEHGNSKEVIGHVVQELPADAVDDKRDAVFGEISDRGPNYRAMGFWATLVVMLKTQIGLGVLSMPFLFQVIGMVPGVIAFTVMGVCIAWCNYMVGAVKIHYREVYSIDDLGYLIGGKIGRWVMGIALMLYFVPIAGSGMLAVSIAFNAMSVHAQCTAVFVVISALITFAISSIQTLGKISWLAWLGTISVFVAVFTLVVAVGLQDRPSAAPQTGPWDKQLNIAGVPDFASIGSTLGGTVFTLAGTPAFFGIVSEMRRPELFAKPTLWCQAIITSMCLLVGIEVYYFCGIYVASPAPGSAGPLLKRIAYGLGFPGILMSTVVYTHFAAKYLFVKLLRGSPHLSTNTWQHWVYWFSCTGGVSIVAYVIASGVPIFSGLTSLVGSLCGPMLSLEPMGAFYVWHYWYKSDDRSLRNKLHTAWAVAMIVFGIFCQVSGTYGSIVDIKTSFESGATGKPWSCADNSNSV